MLNLVRRQNHLQLVRQFSSKLDVPSIEPCLYKTLKVAKDANRDDVRKAYLTIAKVWHPDKVDGDSEALAYFTHVSKAYETLYDDHKRAIYDDDSIDDEEFFSITVGKFRVNLFLVFFVSLGFSIGYFATRKLGLIGGSKPEGCPVDHKSRVEMAKMAN